METLIKHQTAFINAIGGSTSTHADEQLARAHAQLAVTDSDFDELIHIIEEGLGWHALPRPQADMIIAHFEKRRELIVAND
ncbi:MAG: hypothetical protein ACRDWA_02175 [Acidimicrobiia bacterium]